MKTTGTNCTVSSGNDLYTFDWDEDKSVLEFGVGDALEEEYDFEYQEQLTLEVRGNPQWDGYDARLELIYDEVADTLRVKHPARIQSDRLREQREDAFTHTLDTENTTHSATIDVGANNTLAIVTSTGEFTAGAIKEVKDKNPCILSELP